MNTVFLYRMPRQKTILMILTGEQLVYIDDCGYIGIKIWDSYSSQLYALPCQRTFLWKSILYKIIMKLIMSITTIKLTESLTGWVASHSPELFHIMRKWFPQLCLNPDVWSRHNCWMPYPYVQLHTVVIRKTDYNFQLCIQWSKELHTSAKFDKFSLSCGRFLITVSMYWTTDTVSQSYIMNKQVC